jgi:hypothetical protein
VEPLVGELVHGRGVRAAGVVANAEGEADEAWPFGERLDPEDDSEASGRRREVELDAAGEVGAVARLALAGAQVGEGNPGALVPGPGVRGDLPAGVRAAGKAFRPGGIVELRRQVAGLWCHRLPFAVWRKHLRPVLGDELVPLLGGELAAAGSF